MKTFKELGLSAEIMHALDDLTFVESTPIQAETIPFINESKNDLIALAQTGTGKTAAFSLPILNQLEANSRDLQVIILSPTRELALQIASDIKKFTKYMKGITTTPVYGGENISIQINALKRGTNIVVGTPGRVHDLIRRKNLRLQNIKWVILDEADEMLDMGFKDDLDAILEQTPKERQTLLFSATMSKSVFSIAKRYMNDIKEISVGTKNAGADNVSHEYYQVVARDRFEALKRILDNLPGVYGILFCRTRNETQKVADMLKQANYDAEALHGEISQGMRTKIMARFKKKQIKLLVATDVAARGIDVNDLSHVINYNLPDQNESYTHRSGRTGRAQKSGICISIVTPAESRNIRRLEDMIGKKIEYKKVPGGKEVCKKQIDNFLTEIEDTDIEETDNQEYFVEVIEKLKKHKKEDLIKYFVIHKFNRLMNDYKRAPDLNATTKTKVAGAPRISDADSVNLKVNFGRKQGMDVKGIFALINSNKRLKGVEVGKISLMSDFSIFTVDKKRADEVLSSLQGDNFRGKKIGISKTTMVPSFQGGRKGASNKRRGSFNKTGGGGGFKGRRKPFKRTR